MRTLLLGPRDTRELRPIKTGDSPWPVLGTGEPGDLDRRARRAADWGGARGPHGARRDVIDVPLPLRTRTFLAVAGGFDPFGR